jgi:hypothetical protein
MKFALTLTSTSCTSFLQTSKRSCKRARPKQPWNLQHLSSSILQREIAMSQPTQPPDAINGFDAAHHTAPTAATVPQGSNIVTTPVHNGNPAPTQPHTTYPAVTAHTSNVARHDTPQSAPRTAIPARHTIARSGDGYHPFAATWGPSIFNMVSRSEHDPSFDLSAQRTYIIDHPTTTPRFQCHDLATTWYFRRTIESIRVYDGRTWESMNWMVGRADGEWEVRWRDMPEVGK